MANEAMLPIVVQLKDDASAGLRRVGQNVEISSRQWRQAGTALGRFGQAMTNVLVLTNLLPKSMGNAINTTLLLATTTINAVYAVSQLVKIFQTLNATQRVSIALQSILVSLSGVGIGKVALALGVGATALAATSTLVNRTSGESRTLNIPSAVSVPQARTIHIFNFNAPILGTESELASKLREFDRRLTRLGR